MVLNMNEVTATFGYPIFTIILANSTQSIDISKIITDAFSRDEKILIEKFIDVIIIPKIS